MKQMITMMAVAVGLSAFAAANDPLIPTTVEAGATYDVLCKGEKVFSFAADRTGRINVQGVASRSTLAGDYTVSRTGTLKTTAEQSVQVDDIGSCFNLEGPDYYADGTPVLPGELYALVLVKPGATFKGFFNQKLSDIPTEGSVECVDAENNWFAIFGHATSDGPHCVQELMNLPTPLPEGYEDGTLAVYLLDTRKPGTDELADCYQGLPTFVQAYHELGSAEEPPVSAAGWTKVLLSTDGQRFCFDPSLALNEGFAAIYTYENNRDVWTVRAMPKAWDEKQTENTVFASSDELHVLRQPTPPLTYPCSNEVDYIFNAAKTPEMRALIKKVVSNPALLAAIVTGQPVSEEMLAGFTPAELQLLDGELSTWALAVMPFFQWNADFEVSFDRPVKAGTVFLDGQYDGAAAWNFTTWVGAAFADDLQPGDKIRLLKQGYQEVYLNYSEICTNVIQFKCGAMNLSPENWGTTMSVDLRLYENSGRCNETKNSFSVGVYKYAFQGPLNIKYYSNDVEIASLSTNHDGCTEFPLLAYQTGNPKLAFTGWTNEYGEVVSAIPSRVHVATPETKHLKSWYTGGADTLKLYATFQAAQTVEVAPKEEASESKVAIKVTEKWLTDNGFDPTAENLGEQLEAKQGESQKRPAWQNYLLNLDPDADLKVEKTNGDEDDKALVVSSVEVVAPDAGFHVGYSLDKVDESSAPVKTVVPEQETKDLKINLNPEGDTPTGYYKMNVIITPDNGTEEEAVKIQAENTIGVLKVESDEKLVPIAVPWSSLKDGETISAEELVKTSTLSEDDKLHVYDPEQGAYHNYHLVNGAWAWVNSFQLDANGALTTTEAIPPADDKITRGSGVWLERASTEKPFYLIGQYKSEDPATSVVAAPAVEPEDPAYRPEYNLIAPTGIEPETDLNEVKALRESEDVKAGDQIVIIRNGLPTRYERIGDNNEWGYRKQVYEMRNGRIVAKKVTETGDAKVPAGTGIWYISAGGSPTIDWSEKVGE